MNPTLEGATSLPHLGVIRVQGEDAARFLHGQLTQDFLLLAPGQARLAAFCSAKGRMQASFVAVALAPNDFALVLSRDLLAPTLKRLSMFVLRAKAQLTDASEAFLLQGRAGLSASLPAGAAPLAPWVHQGVDGGHLVGLYPADGTPRALWLAPLGTPAPDAPALDGALWLWSEVRSGVAQVTAPVTEAFVPQMLNYESVGGVNFKKGCYPGQEVVARSQFRGAIKRRATRAHAPSELLAGMDIYHSDDPEQPCGQVVQAAAAPGGGWDAIVSLPTQMAHSGTLTAVSATGPVVRLLDLPYPLLLDI